MPCGIRGVSQAELRGAGTAHHAAACRQALPVACSLTPRVRLQECGAICYNTTCWQTEIPMNKVSAFSFHCLGLDFFFFSQPDTAAHKLSPCNTFSVQSRSVSCPMETIASGYLVLT